MQCHVHNQCFKVPYASQCYATSGVMQVATLIAILKTARALGLYQDLERVSIPGEGIIAIPEAMLQRAVGHASQTLQLDALQLACVHPRATNLPGGRLYCCCLLLHTMYCLCLEKHNGDLGQQRASLTQSWPAGCASHEVVPG